MADWPVTQDHVFGGIRTVLETDFDMTFSPVMLETINKRDLSKYTAVVLPHSGMDIRGGPGFNDGYKGKLNTQNLRDYVTGGGTLIAMHGASEIIANDEVLGVGVEFKDWAEYTNGAILRAEFHDKPDPGYLLDWRPGLKEVGMHMLASGYEKKTFGAPAAFPVILEAEEDTEVIASYASDQNTLLLDGFVLEQDL